ncbi:thiamine-phosphate kinase [Labilibaculum euxinus]|uniref:Thiamine-monophosphate kinase n=1 Tax=Labilibaculum euxinus TaxID=2686357 RepID=A0A7M4D4U0_9BACT|nr:thiamine-phosphate kinase [Labilibaculum euxinus]MUP37669.1 thiamine-phosphate kinase [Labilibaculum euxinus]MVB06874.1 thiamine-phosphate kinase [Labilibaculum euxinus]
MQENNAKGTDIATLGEFGLIKHLTKNIKLKHASTNVGVGDDAAVLDYQNKKTVVTTDLLLEGIHFDLMYTPLKHLGYKSIAVNVSDIYAMNALPKQVTVSIAISKRFTLEAIEELYEGINLACENYNVDLVGGDTTSSLTGLCISVTAIGEADADQLAYRSGAKENDLICVSGNLGAAFAGLQLLEREKRVYDNNPAMQPDLTGHDYILERQLKPEARKDIYERLQDAKIVPSSMIDISDGLSSDIMHICEESKVGCQIYEEKIPVDYETHKMAEELNMNYSTFSLNGGEDYELLFTVPLDQFDAIEKIEDVKIIGHITDISKGKYLVTRDGVEIELQAQGWNPIKED